MDNIYICSSLKNWKLNKKLASLLEKNHFTTYLPQRDTNEESFHTIYTGNLSGIENCDIFLAVTLNHGKDFAFEVGYAKGKGKKIITFGEINNCKSDEMLYEALSKPIKLFPKLLKLITVS